MRSNRQPDATHGNGFRLFPPVRAGAICDRLPPVAAAGLFLKKGRLSSRRFLIAPPLVLPDGWMLSSFLALVAHRVDGSCPGFSVP
jgi:hypothetical protein